MGKIRSNYVNSQGRECNITAYIPETDSYVTQRAYMADITPTLYFADDNTIKYNPIRFAFVGGVYNG
jgi:hypothetical protein